MKIKYVGKADAVELPLPFGGHKVCPKNEIVDVPDSMRDGLLAQPDNWREVKEKKNGSR